MTYIYIYSNTYIYILYDIYVYIMCIYIYIYDIIVCLKTGYTSPRPHADSI